MADHGGGGVKVAGANEGLDTIVESETRANEGEGGVQKARSVGAMGGGACGGNTKGAGWRRFCNCGGWCELPTALSDGDKQ